MEAKEGFALLCLCCCWSCWSYKAVSMIPVGRTFGDNPSAIYSHCRFTKGSPKLYNCPPDYRSPGGFANLSQPSSPRRYKNLWLGMLMDIAGHDLAQFVEAEANFIDHVEIEGIVKIALTQKDPPWGLDRIDHNPGEKDLNNLYNVSSSGDGVHVYVLDTGIRCTHRDFWYDDGRTDSRGRRLSRCLDGFDGIRDGGGLNDCNGHGTHCAAAKVHRAGKEIHTGSCRASGISDVELPLRAVCCQEGSKSFTWEKSAVDKCLIEKCQ